MEMRLASEDVQKETLTIGGSDTGLNPVMVASYAVYGIVMVGAHFLDQFLSQRVRDNTLQRRRPQHRLTPPPLPPSCKSCTTSTRRSCAASGWS